MSTAIAERPMESALIERVLLHGDLRQLTPAQKVSYYKAVCDSVGLNPLTQPFQYLTLNGKEILYATRAATEQLRTVHQVSVQITAREVTEDCYVVTARASMPNGRQDENIGAVPIAGLKGEARANAMMKAETKAKRRVTLAICGLGMLDETEVASIEQAPVSRAPLATSTSHDSLQPSVPNGGDSGINTQTGEDMSARPEPPPGYFYVQGYQLKNGWHEAYLLHYDGQGGALRVSTKTQVGFLLNDAEQNGVPVSVDVTMKKNGKGEAYVNKVSLLKPEPDDSDLGEQVDEADIPF